MLVFYDAIHDHGVSNESIRYVFETAFESDMAMIEDADPERWIMVGNDRDRKQIEVGVLKMTSGDWLAIHAMKARKSTIDAIRKARYGR